MERFTRDSMMSRLWLKAPFQREWRTGKRIWTWIILTLSSTWRRCGWASTRYSITIGSWVSNKNGILEINFKKKILLSLHTIWINFFRRFTAEATNLFLRENGQEVLKVMEPQLKRKLSVLFAGIVNQLLRHVPVEVFLLPWNRVFLLLRLLLFFSFFFLSLSC